MFFVSEAIEINEPFNIGIQGSYIRQPGLVFACFEMCKKDALYMYQDVNESKHDTTFFRFTSKYMHRLECTILSVDNDYTIKRPDLYSIPE